MSEKAISERALDRMFSTYIRDRDPECRIRLCNPGHTFAIIPATATDAAHLLGKGAHPRLRWNPDNAMGACRPCHRFMTDHPTQWLHWILNRIGAEKYDELLRLDRERGKQDLEAISARLKAIAGPKA